MITLVPFPSFAESFSVLSKEDLFQTFNASKYIKRIILSKNEAIHPGTVAFASDPNVYLWEHYPNALKLYISFGYLEIVKRNFKSKRPLEEKENPIINRHLNMPRWINSKIHDSHKAYLLRKNSKHYSKVFKNVDPDLPLYWPSKTPHPGGLTPPPVVV